MKWTKLSTQLWWVPTSTDRNLTASLAEDWLWPAAAQSAPFFVRMCQEDLLSHLPQRRSR